MVLDVRANQTDTPPCAKSDGNNKSKKTRDDSGRIFLHNVHCKLQNLRCEWNPSSPREETNGIEYGENKEYNSGGIIFLNEINDGSAET